MMAKPSFTMICVCQFHTSVGFTSFLRNTKEQEWATRQADHQRAIQGHLRPLILVNIATHPFTANDRLVYMANRIRNATIRQKRPMASDRAKPRMAYENSCCFREGFLLTQRETECSEYSCPNIAITMSSRCPVKDLIHVTKYFHH